MYTYSHIRNVINVQKPITKLRKNEFGENFNRVSAILVYLNKMIVMAHIQHSLSLINCLLESFYK